MRQPNEQAPPGIKLCKDCRWYKDLGSIFQVKPACGVEKLIDPTDGDKLYRDAYLQRRASGLCGPEAKLFEADSDTPTPERSGSR